MLFYIVYFTHPPDLSGYDTIILGGPVWGLTLSNPLPAFIRQSDFKGKTVSAFWTFYDHDEKYAQDVKKECAGAIVKAGLSLPRSAMRSESSLSEKLDGWIAAMEHCTASSVGKSISIAK